jgi:hypothetical protein
MAAMLLLLAIAAPSSAEETPTLDGFQPAAAVIGAPVILTGTLLTTATDVQFNGVSATFVVQSDVEIDAVVPDGATSGPIGVTTADGWAVTADPFTVLPYVGGLSRPSAAVGASVSIFGSHLALTTDVQFNGVGASFVVDSDAQVTATIPDGAATGVVTVVTPDGSAESGDFTVLPPDIVLILTDDQTWTELDQMAILQADIAANGVTFANAFDENPLCCPSRATILTGRFSHSTDIYDNVAPHGGFDTFSTNGGETSTVATWLHDAGYVTGMVGKYLNGYSSESAAHVPPGWDTWDALLVGDESAGYFNYQMS